MKAKIKLKPFRTKEEEAETYLRARGWEYSRLKDAWWHRQTETVMVIRATREGYIFEEYKQ